jgi:hypothetical protein
MCLRVEAPPASKPPKDTFNAGGILVGGVIYWPLNTASKNEARFWKVDELLVCFS